MFNCSIFITNSATEFSVLLIEQIEIWMNNKYKIGININC